MSKSSIRMNHLLEALGSHIGIRDLKLNDDHVCRLVLDKTLVIDIEHIVGTETVHVYAVVGTHLGNGPTVYRKLLSANLFGNGTGGAVLAFDDQRDEVLLTHTFDLEVVTPEKFVATLDSFVGYVETWTNELLAESEDEDEESDDDSSEDPNGFIRV